MLLLAQTNLASDLVDEFLRLRRDVATARLGGSSPGKFVETCVQVLQHLESGRYEKKPSVDDFLQKLESRASSLPDGLRICCSRIARSMYTLRNKRNISHKGEVDPNTYDLRLLHGAAQWVMAELIRTVSTVPMEEAGRLIDQVQAPVGGLIEDFGSRKLVLADLAAKDEVLVLLHSDYPNYVSLAAIIKSADRRGESTIRNNVNILWRERLVEGSPKDGFKLTERGLRAAIAVVASATATAEALKKPSQPKKRRRR